VSDSWYRDPLPPHEDFDGNLWTLDGICLNPKLGPEPHPDLALINLQTEIAMAFAGDLDSVHSDYWRRAYPGAF
jgi:hypothetical protein